MDSSTLKPVFWQAKAKSPAKEEREIEATGIRFTQSGDSLEREMREDEEEENKHPFYGKNNAAVRRQGMLEDV